MYFEFGETRCFSDRNKDRKIDCLGDYFHDYVT